MEYVQKTIRRQDRLMPESRAQELIKCAEYGVLSMTDEHGEAYGVPVNFVWNGDSVAYIHCAPVGKKLRAMELHPTVSLCVVGRTCVQPEKFTTSYESVVLKGRAQVVTNEEERLHALEMLIDRFSPEYKSEGMKAAAKSMKRVAVVRIDFYQYSGKSKDM